MRRTSRGASRPARYAVVTLVVALYVALGFLFGLDRAAYQLLGLPILLLPARRRPPSAARVLAGRPPRSAGPLTVPNTAHAVLDAGRGLLAAFL